MSKHILAVCALLTIVVPTNDVFACGGGCTSTVKTITCTFCHDQAGCPLAGFCSVANCTGANSDLSKVVQQNDYGDENTVNCSANGYGCETQGCASPTQIYVGWYCDVSGQYTPTWYGMCCNGD
jgi:hypothetical protein